MIRVVVEVEPRPYEAVIESGLVERAGAQLRELLVGRAGVFVVTVPPVRRKWGKKLLASLAQAGLDAKMIEMADGEPAKKLATVEALAEKLAKLGADRDAVIVAFGGGVVGDAAGLLASLYMRGVGVVQVPTTVLAQVDAAIGGKTGVNLRAGKNLLGTFHQPRAVLIDPAVLASLPAREFRAGLYEALKCGVIGNPQLFVRFEENRDRILARDRETLEWVIGESVKQKAAVVAADEKESGLRQILNFGHTIGHALEAESGYRGFLHGEAVAWGMVAATSIALTIGKLENVTARRISGAVLGLGKLPPVSVKPANILRRLQADKKTRDGVVHFVLPREIGQVEIVRGVPEKVVLEAMGELRRLSGR
ncbi:MAG TPA: 3-dehydroquinate synthase [Terriglobales bacterium]|nr:3-dehydroquinate synthase [Terriglobales bacterium]